MFDSYKSEQYQQRIGVFVIGCINIKMSIMKRTSVLGKFLFVAFSAILFFIKIPEKTYAGRMCVV